MAKPVFSPEQYELRNELPIFVSNEQSVQIAQTTTRVNDQINFVAQFLGWSGPNYWTSLTTTVHQKRALLGGTFGVYNSYTLLPLLQIRTWEQTVWTEFRPNIAIGQRVIIGDSQTFIYGLEVKDSVLILDLGVLPDAVITLLQQGAAIKVDCPENRPFPFYRPNAEASADAEFRCSVGSTTSENNFYVFAELILSPFEQNNKLLPYKNLCLFAGSYYYFDRAVYLSASRYNLAPWIEAQWVESKGLWQLYIPESVTGNELAIVWDYAVENTKKRVISSAYFQVLAWTDPSDWGNAGESFNPVVDEFIISKTYNTAGINFSLGTFLALGDTPPLSDNPLWFDAGNSIVYAYSNSQWNAVGVVNGAQQLAGNDAPPPVNYEFSPGSIWQSPENEVYIWDAGSQSPEFYYFFSNGLIDGFFYIDPSYQNVQGLYFYNPDNFYIHNPNFIDSSGLIVFNCQLDADGFYYNNADVGAPDWFKVDFYEQVGLPGQWVSSYSSNIYVLVNGLEIPNNYRTENFAILWSLSGGFLSVTYEALNDTGEVFVPTITLGSFNGLSVEYIDISSDFQSRQDIVTTVPFSESGVLNNFLGAWGNKGGARSMDFAFDSLDIHGYNEQQALLLKKIEEPVSFDTLLNLVSGATIFIGDSPPPSPTVGEYYYNNEVGALSVYYEDRDKLYHWVEVNYPISICQIGTPDCSYSPLKPILSTGGCFLTNGDTWQDPGSTAVTVYYDSPNGYSAWVEMNWNQETKQGWQAVNPPSLIPDYSVLTILLTDDFIELEPNVPYTTADYTFYYTIQDIACTFTFYYEALSPNGIQTQPSVYVAVSNFSYPPANITNYVFANAEWYQAPAVQNAESVLRPWKTQSLEVTTETSVFEDTYINGFRADLNLGPGDENWTRSFVRLPSEYAREGKVWNQTELVMQDFAYFGTPGQQKDMRCPNPDNRPQIFEEVVFYQKDPAVGALLFSAPYLYSDVDGFNSLTSFFPNRTTSTGEFKEADIDFVTDDTYDEWQEGDLSEYDPLHNRTVFANGDWEGVYVEPTGNRPLSGFLERDLRVKSIIPVPAPVWDASIYKYPPLCQFGADTYAEDPNNYKVGYAYFTADLSASEDGFFDQTKDVAWREPLVEDQTLYILKN